MLNINSHLENENQNHHEIPLQNCWTTKIKRRMKCWEGSGEAVTLPYCWGIATLEKQYSNSAVSYTETTIQSKIPFLGTTPKTRKHAHSKTPTQVFTAAYS